MDIPTEESLQQMSYTELKRFAKKRGIKRANKKKSKSLIALILEGAQSAEDSFVTMEQKVINSCKKNKQEMFDKDKEVPSDTPKRDTFTIESPLDVSLALNGDSVTSSASPVLKLSPAEHEVSLNVTLTRGSEKKGKKRKVSFVTPIRRSARLSVLTPHFASVKDRPKTPIPSRGSSARKRKSPLTLEKKLFSGSLYIANSAGRKSSEGGKVKRPSTPMPNPKPERMKLNSTGLLETPISTPVATQITSAVQLSKQKQLLKDSPGLPVASIATPVSTPDTSIVQLFKQKKSPKDTPSHLKAAIAIPVSTPNAFVVQLSKQKKLPKGTPVPIIKSALTPALLSSTKAKRTSPRNSAAKRVVPLTNPRSKNTFTPRSGIKRTATPSNLKVHSVTPKILVKQNSPLQMSSAKVKKTVTPNFNKLHQKQFDKMESIDEYIKRKQLNSSKKVEERKKIHDALKIGSSKKMAVKKNTRIPKKFNGIPFIPSITSTADIKTNFAFGVSRQAATPGKRLPAIKFGSHNESSLSKKLKEGAVKSSRPALKENTPLKRKAFDLKASLSKKLRYKPHTGPLKPLDQVNLNTSIFTGAGQPKITAPESRVIKAKRIEARGALRGVRKNKRFELQMQNRKAAMAK